MHTCGGPLRDIRPSKSRESTSLKLLVNALKTRGAKDRKDASVLKRRQSSRSEGQGNFVFTFAIHSNTLFGTSLYLLCDPIREVRNFEAQVATQEMARSDDIICPKTGGLANYLNDETFSRRKCFVFVLSFR
jgi:hypothetical protein